MQGRWFRIASLVVPAMLAARFVRTDEAILREVAPVLIMLWIVMAGALVMRFVEAREERRKTQVSPWDAIDILTATGASTMWLGAGALLAAGASGWASLSVVGILGLGTMYLVTAWTALAACGNERWRSASVERAIAPAIATEGDPLREEIKVTGIGIPAGMRLFISGQALRFGKTTRYVLGTESSKAEVALASDLGPAPRGDHEVPPLQLWFGDVLGLTRTPAIERGESHVAVMPRPAVIDNAVKALGAGGDAMVASPAQLPTEGTFRIREYVPGDDTRRIHWVRSAQQDQLIMRLPDEVPPADPVIRIILDNELPVVEPMTSRAPDELFDALVRVWLGVGKALAASGSRVVLVTAIADKGIVKRIERPLFPRSSQEALRVGMRVGWQDSIPLDTLIGKHPIQQIVVTGRPRRTHVPVAWVVVPEGSWTTAEPAMPEPSATTHPFPSGAPENRAVERTRERKRIEKMWQDRMLFTHIVGWTDWSRYSGHHVARPANGDQSRISLGVIP
jgi:uncharacterized protein (DUF58 family)